MTDSPIQGATRASNANFAAPELTVVNFPSRRCRSRVYRCVSLIRHHSIKAELTCYVRNRRRAGTAFAAIRGAGLNFGVCRQIPVFTDRSQPKKSRTDARFVENGTARFCCPCCWEARWFYSNSAKLRFSSVTLNWPIFWNTAAGLDGIGSVRAVRFLYLYMPKQRAYPCRSLAVGSASAMESGKLICARLKIRSPTHRATGLGVDGYQLSFRGFA
jgi:hypothetical protein